MREKYIEERFPRWWSYDRCSDIETENGTVGSALNLEHAYMLIQEHNRLLEEMVKLAQKFDEVNPEEFSKHWYGEMK